MSDKIFKRINIAYTMVDRSNPQAKFNRRIEDVTDINSCIFQTAKSAHQVGMKISTFTVEVEYES